VTPIASRPEVVEIEPQIRPLLDGHLMIRMQVPLAAVVPVAKLRKHLVRRRRTQAPAPELLHDLRLPSAIDAPPAVPDEAQNPQASVILHRIPARRSIRGVRLIPAGVHRSALGW
jgi:hypothetical protein